MARNDDHLMIYFQCDLYQFRNFKRLDPRKVNSNVDLIKTIRRENLDTFWGREPSTLKNHKKWW